MRNTTRSIVTYRLKYLAYRIVIGSAIRRARTVLTVSRFTERDILREYPRARGKTVVAYEGCDLPEPVHGIGEEKDIRGILGPYFLYVGNAYPHKNLEAFIPLAKKFPDIGFVLVGREDYFYRRFRKRAEEAGAGNISLIGYVPDADLVRLYRGARGYVFPSLYEGFGLPPLEAMRLGTPVIAADRGSLPEILGDAAMFFDPDRRGDLEWAVGELLHEPGLAEELSRKGVGRAARFRWDTLAEITLEAYGSAFIEEPV